MRGESISPESSLQYVPVKALDDFVLTLYNVSIDVKRGQCFFLSRMTFEAHRRSRDKFRRVLLKEIKYKDMFSKRKIFNFNEKYRVFDPILVYNDGEIGDQINAYHLLRMYKESKQGRSSKIFYACPRVFHEFLGMLEPKIFEQMITFPFSCNLLNSASAYLPIVETSHLIPLGNGPMGPNDRVGPFDIFTLKNIKTRINSTELEKSKIIINKEKEDKIKSILPAKSLFVSTLVPGFVRFVDEDHTMEMDDEGYFFVTKKELDLFFDYIEKNTEYKIVYVNRVRKNYFNQNFIYEYLSSRCSEGSTTERKQRYIDLTEHYGNCFSNYFLMIENCDKYISFDHRDLVYPLTKVYESKFLVTKPEWVMFPPPSVGGVETIEEDDIGEENGILYLNQFGNRAWEAFVNEPSTTIPSTEGTNHIVGIGEEGTTIYDSSNSTAAINAAADVR